jgi:hypothetical protein
MANGSQIDRFERVPAPYRLAQLKKVTHAVYDPQRSLDAPVSAIRPFMVLCGSLGRALQQLHVAAGRRQLIVEFVFGSLNR